MKSLEDKIVDLIWDKAFCDECKPPSKSFIRLDVIKILDELK